MQEGITTGPEEATALPLAGAASPPEEGAAILSGTVIGADKPVLNVAPQANAFSDCTQPERYASQVKVSPDML